MNRIFLSLCLAFLAFCFSGSVYAENFAEQPEVQSFINAMVKKHGFKRDQLITLFSKVKKRPQVLQSVHAPMEQATWGKYRKIFINDSHIRSGVAFWDRHQEALARAERTYGVPASIIVATIGVETKYGKNKGEYPVIDALTNIAFSKSPRAPYFRSELEEFLLLSREQHLNPLKVKGSYAGAIGQPQFMPSSYRYYAVSFSGNNKIDLSNNIDDIIGSVANYYKKHGWKTNSPVAIPTAVEKSQTSFFSALASLFDSSTYNSIDDLVAHGIVPRANPPANEKVRIVELQGQNGKEYWLGLHNFSVIKRYNSSDLYAMAVYQLSYYITSLREKMNNV